MWVTVMTLAVVPALFSSLVLTLLSLILGTRIPMLKPQGWTFLRLFCCYLTIAIVFLLVGVFSTHLFGLFALIPGVVAVGITFKFLFGASSKGAALFGFVGSIIVGAAYALIACSAYAIFY